MISEDYVSLEIAKLLKEKGFDEGCSFVVNAISKSVMPVSWPTTNSDIEDEKINLIALPTLQMSMKWLREVHKIYIDISPTYCEVEKTIHFIWQILDSNYDVVGDCEIFYGKYETACEEAIKYCLENLI